MVWSVAVATGGSNAQNAARDTLMQRLSKLGKEIPLPYHPVLEQMPGIVSGFTDRTFDFSVFVRYEPLLEQMLQEREMPVCLKYLPAAFSGMDGSFTRQQRAGVWSLPVLVALRAGLTVTEAHDERYDVALATGVALDYLSNLYGYYHDWWSAILAYANSPAALNAIRLRHGEESILQPWDYYEGALLPEVKVIPLFIALNYFGARADRAIFARSDEPSCEQVTFHRPLALEPLCDALGTTVRTFSASNPLYRSNPILPLSGHTLSLPLDQALRFEKVQDSLYRVTELLMDSLMTAAVGDRKKGERRGALLSADLGEGRSTDDTGKRVGNTTGSGAKKTSAQKSVQVGAQQRTTVYTVRSGDTLTKIARKYKVRVSDIQRWNRLKSDRINIGQRLTIYIQ